MLIFFAFFFVFFLFKKKKERARWIMIFFSKELLFKVKLLIQKHDFDAQSKSDLFKKKFMIRQFIHFPDSLNIVLILVLDCEFFCAKLVEFPLMMMLIKK